MDEKDVLKGGTEKMGGRQGMGENGEKLMRNWKEIGRERA